MHSVTAIIALAGATAAIAACPNMCSGHGRCNEFDKCECYRYDGTSKDRRIMWTGADCSQRTCPYDIAFADISTDDHSVPTSAIHLNPQTAFDGTPRAATDSHVSYLRVDSSDYALTESKTFNVRVYKVTAGASDAVQFQWKLAEHDTYSRLFTLTEGDGITKAVELGRDYGTTDANGYAFGNLANQGVSNTGVRVYLADTVDPTKIMPNHLYTFTVKHVSGRPYMANNAETSHQETECSSRGMCDRSSGRCECFSGYEGEACQRTACPNDCSGHGVCQSQERFLADVGSASFTYKNRANGGAFDADKEFGCLCDTGYRGADCSLVECPSGADPLGGAGGIGVDSSWNLASALDCSGRGVCDYSSGICNCFKGYAGERCETQTVFV